MTVADLIEDLAKFPRDKTVKVVLRSVCNCDEGGDYEIGLSADDAAEADEVRHEGAYILIWGGRS